jgi:hypothetical protein
MDARMEISQIEGNGAQLKQKYAPSTISTKVIAQAKLSLTLANTLWDIQMVTAKIPQMPFNQSWEKPMLLEADVCSELSLIRDMFLDLLEQDVSSIAAPQMGK